MQDKSTYQSPLCSRYASREMRALFSEDTRTKTWRRLWVALAEAEHALGLPVTKAQVEELRAHVDDIDYDAIAKKEKEIRHDVMAHVYAYGLVCPGAKGIIHLGATSCYVTDNADILIYREALRAVREKLLSVIQNLAAFAKEYRVLPTLGYTHFQPAQPVTVGKRACLWMQDLVMDYEELLFVEQALRLLGSKGTTGTQASFLELFDGDHEKVKALDEAIAAAFSMPGCYPVTGQTYPRKVDSRILNALSALAQSAYRFANDLRLLQHMHEVEEPFEKNQVGSSAMAYKRNPMRSERICSLSRYVMANAQNAPMTASTQWLERTLDDSANRRISLPEAFLAADSILNLLINVTDGLAVYPAVIRKNLMEQLPFMATENLLMAAVKKGGDRQALHEVIRTHSMAAAARMKEEGAPCDLLERLVKDGSLGLNEEELQGTLDPQRYIGRAPEQVDEYLEYTVQPLLMREGATKRQVQIDV
ncbi:adenylosuccinate lyase [Christensenellaceae bacterium OttesenSCG-928-L17]|nr:adenylosuccinate lyase [Christensenellaceae bacterium OttesenSCG-928-L17]